MSLTLSACDPEKAKKPSSNFIDLRQVTITHRLDSLSGPINQPGLPCKKDANNPSFVGADFADYAKQVAAKMRAAGLRVSLADGTKTLGKNIREAEITKVPLMAVVGAKEAESNTLSVRLRGGRGDTGAVDVDDIMARMRKAVESTDHTVALG